MLKTTNVPEMNNQPSQDVISPGGICTECGISANVLTCIKKYGKIPLQLNYSVSTYHNGVCEVCLKSKPVTEARDFFYPDFSLLEGKV